MEIVQIPSPRGSLSADLVLTLLAELSATVEAMRQEMARHGIGTFGIPLGQSRIAQDQAAEASSADLSKRQRQVLAGIVRGCPNKIIAWELGLSVRTVEAYRAQLFERLGARNAADAVRLSLAAGLDGAADSAASG
jgi:DNA-binding NarL/FixJ family response regulator